VPKLQTNPRTQPPFWEIDNYCEHSGLPLLWRRARSSQCRGITAFQRLAISVGAHIPRHAAGCRFDTFAAWAYTMEPCETCSARNEQFDFMLCIGDPMPRITRPTIEEVIRLMVKVATDLHAVITHELRCSVATAKPVALASHPQLQARLTTAFGRHAATVGTSRRNLGIDFAAGNSRTYECSRPGLKNRIGKLKGCRRRLLATRRPGRDPRKIYRTCLEIFGMYGDSCDGSRPSGTLGTTALFSQVGRNPRGLPTAFGVPRCARRDIDSPGIGARHLVVQDCLKGECGSLPGQPMPFPSSLPARAAHSSRLPATWSQVRRPFGAAIHSLIRIWWSLHTLFIFEDPVR